MVSEEVEEHAMKKTLTKNTTSALIVLLATVAAACAGPKELDEHPCPPGGTALTYESFGKAFIDSQCQSCHASRSVLRQGAPSEYFFDTQADVVRWRARIFVRSAAENDSMPPGPSDPARGERDKLADWLACGAQ